MKNLAVSLGARVLKAMGNEKRLEILFQLLEKEQNVGELEKKVGLSQSALSQHLAVLRGENLVKTRREAQTIFYSLHGENVVKVLKLLLEMYQHRY